MRLLFTPQGRADHHYWQVNDLFMAKRLDHLLESTQRAPFRGAGDPLRLRHVLDDCWSRRIDLEHRLVYLVDHNEVVVLQARYHYESDVTMSNTTTRWKEERGSVFSARA
jgi:toxin YoeB